MQSPQQTGNVVVDGLLAVWGAFVSILQYADLQQLNQGAGVIVAALTAILLIYRIALAHFELTDEEAQA